MSLSLSLPLALAATVLEALIGYPAPLYRAIGHPVTWMGRWLGGLDKLMNRPRLSFAARRALGVVALGLYLASVGLVAWLAMRALLPLGPLGFVVLTLLAASLPAQRSLATHVRAVADGLDAESRRGTPRGREDRRAQSGRAGRSRASRARRSRAWRRISPTASSRRSFGLRAGGLVGGALYKAINTADSMIGHKDERHAAFGWAAARLDDLVNLPASRLAALWLVLAAALTSGASAREAARAVWRDAARHRSPNAGWPEAAMAGALGLKLAGPRVYGETLVDDAFMGDGRREAGAADIRRALRLYRWACAIEAVALAAAAFALWLTSRGSSLFGLP